MVDSLSLVQRECSDEDKRIAGSLGRKTCSYQITAKRYPMSTFLKKNRPGTDHFRSIYRVWRPAIAERNGKKEKRKATRYPLQGTPNTRRFRWNLVIADGMAA